MYCTKYCVFQIYKSRKLGVVKWSRRSLLRANRSRSTPHSPRICCLHSVSEQSIIYNLNSPLGMKDENTTDIPHSDGKFMKRCIVSSSCHSIDLTKTDSSHGFKRRMDFQHSDITLDPQAVSPCLKFERGSSNDGSSTKTLDSGATLSLVN